jgi:hypothetical protein
VRFVPSATNWNSIVLKKEATLEHCRIVGAPVGIECQYATGNITIKNTFIARSFIVKLGTGTVSVNGVEVSDTSASMAPPLVKHFPDTISSLNEEYNNDGRIDELTNHEDSEVAADLIVPQRNALLANYPNPFNPETWIPYQLSQDAAVRIHIYDQTGRRIRTLDLGLQSAGDYTTRHRRESCPCGTIFSAAHWRESCPCGTIFSDGRNANGEKVASGIYSNGGQRLLRRQEDAGCQVITEKQATARKRLS